MSKDSLDQVNEEIARLQRRKAAIEHGREEHRRKAEARARKKAASDAYRSQATLEMAEKRNADLRKARAFEAEHPDAARMLRRGEHVEREYTGKRYDTIDRFAHG